MNSTQVLALERLMLRCLKKKLFKVAGMRSLSTSAVNFTEKLRMSYVHNPGIRPLVNLTIGQILDDSAERYPDIECIVDLSRGKRCTYVQMRDRADKMAAGLMELGLKRGERVALWGPNSYEWCLSYYAIARAGLVLVPINPAYQAKEFRYCLNKVGVKAVICDHKFKTQDYYKLTVEAAPGIDKKGKSQEVPSLEHIIVVTDEQLPGAIRFKDLESAASNKAINVVRDLQGSIQCDEPCNVQYTSGTTGSPKAATLSHHNIVNNATCNVRRAQIKGHHINCLVAPLFHCAANVGLLLAGLCEAHTNVIPCPIFEPLKTLQGIESERCSILLAVPTMYVDLLSHQDFAKYDVSSIEYLLVGAAVCPVELLKAMKKKLNPKVITNAYGMTETSPVSFATSPDDPADKAIGSVGYPVEHAEVKVVDKDGNIVPVGTPGELCVRGYLTMLGYWGDEEKTAETIGKDRWLRTGDLFVLDEDGYGHIVGRSKDMIIRGGENVYPKEIEEFLHTHPKILDVHVVGLPDYRMGEEVCAWIRLKEGEELTASNVKQFCKGQLSHYKIPRYIHFTEDYPKTASGKVQKFKVREQSLKIFGLDENGKSLEEVCSTL